jgi:alkyl sulfatase BDS1-like metallo-beta-lactamase superfamily hydrolase
MGIIIGNRGYIIIDPLTSVDTARAVMQLANDHLGKKPITAVIYSHSHADHWSGVKGIISEQDVKTGKVKVIAPAGFMKDAVSENVYAGNAMMRRAQYMYGALLPRRAKGQVDAGLGKSLPSVISSSLISPTNSVLKSGQEITVDGVRIVFQLTPGTEAPANMNFHFPQLRTLFMADNCVATLHNLLTPRGSQIRDAKAWAGFIYEALDLFADESDVVILGHTWPRWGKERIINFLSKQAAAYKYIHDQTLRLANQGYTMTEIAEELQLPDTLANEWFNRDYYATVGWNAKAVYQYYLGWYDGNPANFNPLPPVEASKKYVEYMGGADLVLSKASEAFEKGEYRWVAQVLNHVVFADPKNEKARRLQADALEQLGYQSESAVFRNFYLFGAQELRHGIKKPRGKMSPPLDVVQALTPDMIFDSMAVRLNGPKAKGKAITINWYFSDTNERYILYLDNSVLNHIAGRQSKSADCSIEIRRDLFNKVIAGQTTFPARILLGQIKYQGSIKKLSELMALLDDPEPFFNIVTP